MCICIYSARWFKQASCCSGKRSNSPLQLQVRQQKRATELYSEHGCTMAKESHCVHSSLFTLCKPTYFRSGQAGTCWLLPPGPECPKVWDFGIKHPNPGGSRGLQQNSSNLPRNTAFPGTCSMHAKTYKRGGVLHQKYYRAGKYTVLMGPHNYTIREIQEKEIPSAMLKVAREGNMCAPQLEHHLGSFSPRGGRTQGVRVYRGAP